MQEAPASSPPGIQSVVPGAQQHSTASVVEQRGTNVSVAPHVGMLGGQVAAPSTVAGSCGVLGTQQHSTANVVEQRETNGFVVPQVSMLGGQVAASKPFGSQCPPADAHPVASGGVWWMCHLCPAVSFPVTTSAGLGFGDSLTRRGCAHQQLWLSWRRSGSGCRDPTS